MDRELRSSSCYAGHGRKRPLSRDLRDQVLIPRIQKANRATGKTSRCRTPRKVLVGEAGSRSEIAEPANRKFNYIISIGSRSRASLWLARFVRVAAAEPATPRPHHRDQFVSALFAISS